MTFILLRYTMYDISPFMTWCVLMSNPPEDWVELNQYLPKRLPLFRCDSRFPFTQLLIPLCSTVSVHFFRHGTRSVRPNLGSRRSSHIKIRSKSLRCRESRSIDILTLLLHVWYIPTPLLLYNDNSSSNNFTPWTVTVHVGRQRPSDLPPLLLSYHRRDE